MATMTNGEYTRVACRGIAAGSLCILDSTLEQFRMNAETAGIKVNERVLEIKKLLREFSNEIATESWNDYRKRNEGREE